MLRFLIQRGALSILVCLMVMAVSFLLTRLSGDLAVSIAGPNATGEDIEMVRQAYGLDRPLILQFLEWASSALRGDFGDSYFYHAPVATLIFERLPVTITLGLVGLSIAIIIGIPLGIVAALYEGTVFDRAIAFFALIGQALPNFWLGLLFVIWFGVYWQLLPISGVDTWQGYIMPGIVLASSSIPVLMRLTRSGMIDALSSDYVRTARAKGLRHSSVVLKHALRNAAMPVVSIAAVQLGFMLGGSIIIETVFALNGVGYLAWEAISKNDFPVVQAVVLFLAVIFILLTFLSDVVNAMLDPRLRI
ncbi:ABC transporter permease [Mesorhizobium sp. YR577]|uniref:ABC transporter permease n=1 Tax=Mesorhizobium sp. YR577 TaxID=1884373 RepID=UPI0008F431E5|nr:ABC transporter permease [Mesorhizobium sp. YR577]SFU21792.1 peptide/nickel transport system permease protein [Mesorhizobium sp. YR577]